MQELHPNSLWLGHAHDARDPRRLFDAGIAAVVDVAMEEAPAQLPRELIYCRFPLLDGGGNEPPRLLIAVQTIVDLLGGRIPVLVACSAGLSRSPALAAFALAAHLGQQPENVLARIGEQKRLQIKGEFWSQVNDVFANVRTSDAS